MLDNKKLLILNQKNINEYSADVKDITNINNENVLNSDNLNQEKNNLVNNTTAETKYTKELRFWKIYQSVIISFVLTFSILYTVFTLGIGAMGGAFLTGSFLIFLFVDGFISKYIIKRNEFISDNIYMLHRLITFLKLIFFLLFYFRQLSLNIMAQITKIYMFT